MFRGGYTVGEDGGKTCLPEKLSPKKLTTSAGSWSIKVQSASVASERRAERTGRSLHRTKMVLKE